MLGNNYINSTRDAWTTIPGNSIALTNNRAGNPEEIRFLSNNVVIFVQRITYDENNKPILIACSES